LIGGILLENAYIVVIIKIYKLSKQFQEIPEEERDEDEKIEKKLRKELAKKEVVTFADGKVALVDSSDDSDGDSN
jgi:hypothetical protein